jgi:spermidine synthase
MPDFTETMPEGYGQQFRIDELLYEAKTDHQHLMIFQNAVFGRVMVLDGIVQTTEKDEFIYHEMMAHVPILAHGHARRVLIVGGGDGGMLREVTRHRQVTHVTQVEIDAQVIDLCRRYLPDHSQGAFDDPRVDIVIDDGLGFVRQTDARFDVIISDSTDPIGPGQALFQEDFYTACKRCLTPGGILVTQNGVPFLQLDEVGTTARRIGRVFADWHFYSAAVPTYTGGIMAFAWGSDDKTLRHTTIEVLRSRFTAAEIKTRYYTPEIHAASFALPRYILEAIGKA